MTGKECDLCGRPSGDDAAVCSGCAQDCATALAQVHGNGRTHGLAVDLDIAIGKAAQFGEKGGGKPTKKSEMPLLIDPVASEAAAVLRSTLAGWVRVVYDESHSGLHGPVCHECSHRSCRAIRHDDMPADRLASMARWLVPLVGWARHTPYGAEMIDEILAAVHQARRTIDRPTRRVPLHVPCRAIQLDGETLVPCPGELHAVIAPGLPSDGQVRCSSGDPEHTTTVQAMTDRRRGARVDLRRLDRSA